jgi:hypothetical protein
MGYYSKFSGQLKTTRKMVFAERELFLRTLKESNLEGCISLKSDHKTMCFFLECKCDAAMVADDFRTLRDKFFNKCNLTVNGLIHVQGEGFHDFECIKIKQSKVLVGRGKVVYSFQKIAKPENTISVPEPVIRFDSELRKYN